MNSAITEILCKLPLHPKADSAIQKAVNSADLSVFQAAFEKRVAKARKRFGKTVAVGTLFLNGGLRLPNDQGACSEWLADFCERDQPRALSEKQLRSLAEKLVTTFHESATERAESILVTTEMLFLHSDKFDADNLVQVIDRLLQLEFTGLFEEVCEERGEDEYSLWEVIILGELPFRLGLLLEPFGNLLQSRKPAIAHLSRCLDEAMDSDGTPHAAVGRNLASWIGTFTRTSLMAKAFKENWCSDATAARWKAFVKQSAALLTGDGFVTQSHLPDWTPNTAGHQALAMLNAAASADISASSPVVQFLESLRRGKAVKRTKGSQPANISTQSDWAATALFRSGLAINSDVMSLEWDQADHRFSLNARGTQIFAGAWTNSITVDGVEQPAAEGWVCTCWFHDDEVAFIELECRSGNGLHHVRHVMLALSDHFAILNETVTNPEPHAKIRFESQLSTMGETVCDMNPITRDLWLRRQSVSARAVPIWLADDRVQNASGSCGWKGGRLLMTAEERGGLSLPILLDWHPDREHRDADWNRLTVTERREIVTSHVACGFRARIGTLQLMIYRSLQRGGNLRALIGQHTASESIYGHIKDTGSVIPILHIEAD